MELHSSINGCDDYGNHSLSPLCKTLFNLLTLKPTVMQTDIHPCHAWPLTFSCCRHGDVTWGNSFVSIGRSNRVGSKAAHRYCCFISLFVYAASMCLLLNLPCFMHDMTDAPAMSFVSWAVRLSRQSHKSQPPVVPIPWQLSCLCVFLPAQKEKQADLVMKIQSLRHVKFLFTLLGVTLIPPSWSLEVNPAPPPVLTGLYPIKKKGLSSKRGLIVFSVSASTDAALRLQRFPFYLSALYYAGNYGVGTKGVTSL